MASSIGDPGLLADRFLQQPIPLEQHPVRILPEVARHRGKPIIDDGHRHIKTATLPGIALPDMILAAEDNIVPEPRRDAGAAREQALDRFLALLGRARDADIFKERRVAIRFDVAH